MKPINFKEATKVLQRPSTMTDAECASLHVWSDGKQCVSCWKPSVWERVRILFGGKVYLGVKGGGTQPPVFVTAESPFFRPPFFARVKDKISNMIDCAESFVKSVQNAAKQPDKRKHFVGGMLVSFLIGLYNPFLGFLSGVVAAALKEWWDSKGHGTVEFLDFFFSSMGALCALLITWFISPLIW